jgi:hypothetical protein
MTNTDDTRPVTAHTPEPWCAQPSDYPGGLLIKPIPGQVVAQCDQLPQMEANARRICAAVNACKGIATDALEQGIVRELLQALEEIYNWLTPDWQQSNLGDKARAALAKATGRAA